MKLTIVILACAALCGHALAAGLNDRTWDHIGTSIENGGFEDWGAQYVKVPDAEVKLGSEGAPLSWLARRGAGEASVGIMKDPLIKHSGLASARIEIAEMRDEASLNQHFSVEPNTSYRVRAWVRGKDIVPGKPGAGIIIWANCGPAGAEFWGHQKFLAKQPAQASGTFDWQLFEFPVKTSPEAARLKVVLQLRYASGTAWFDDVEVVKSETVSR